MGYKIEFDYDMEEWEYADTKDEMVLAFETLGDYLVVHGKNIGWRHMETAGLIESHKLWEFLGINGEMRLVAEVDDDEVVVTRYSHDEPMGARFTIRQATEKELEYVQD